MFLTIVVIAAIPPRMGSTGIMVLLLCLGLLFVVRKFFEQSV